MHCFLPDLRSCRSATQPHRHYPRVGSGILRSEDTRRFRMTSVGIPDPEETTTTRHAGTAARLPGKRTAASSKMARSHGAATEFCQNPRWQPSGPKMVILRTARLLFSFALRIEEGPYARRSEINRPLPYAPGFLKRTPTPPPFSGINSIPAA